MEIAIKSEVDSRVLVYPLIKTLSLYGTVAVYTSNPMFSRLIENNLEGGFKNIRVVVSPNGDLEEARQSDEYTVGKYNFVIYDNIGATDYDILIAIVTNHISENYVNDLLYIVSESKTHIIKFGSPAPMPKEKSKPKGKVKDEDTNDEEFNKWDNKKTDEEILQDMLSDRESKWVKFPTFDAIELMEGRHIMMTPDDTLIREFFRLFGKTLSVDERQFTKGARLKDESSCDVSGTDVR